MGRLVATARVDGRGRIYIPPDLRERLQVNAGDFLAFRENHRGRVYIEKLK